MFTRIPFIKRKIRALSLKIFNTIENNSNADFVSNGEKVFVDKLLQTFDDSRPKVIFDIGANVGKYTEMLSTDIANSNISIDFHLFEPTKSCFSTLSHKFSSRDNITLNNFGASNNDSCATIYYDQEQSGLASLYQRNLDSYNIALNQHEEIQLRRLDTYIEEKNITESQF